MAIEKLLLTDAQFPARLKDIPTPPRELYVLGKKSLINPKQSVTIVGSRKVTAYGRAVTERIVRELARHQVTIVSGLALGVDSIAHRAALQYDTPTIAVMPCGLDDVYPRTHQQLAKQILDSGGALISEYPAGTPPLRQHFIARNRLASGMGDCVIITEAAQKSGTLHTASFALEQGKSVMAVPGNITSPMSQGTNKLIKSGAEPLTEAADVLPLLGITEMSPVMGQLAGNEQEAKILQLLQQGTTDASSLQRLSGLSADAFNQTLTMLEITGKIRPLGAGHWSL